MVVVITMAGASSRFRRAGYTVPKYEIVVHGRTLFAWSLESLRSFVEAGWRFVFVVLAEHRPGDFIARECASLGIAEFSVVSIDRMTDGQATTVLAAESVVTDAASPLVIYNIDTFVDPRHLPANEVRGEGWIPCFPGEGSAWSFARADDRGRVVELKEKQRISDNATIGLYSFASFGAYREAYESYFRGPTSSELAERYIAPMYNDVIARGGSVFLHRLPSSAVHPLGTPEDVARFATLSSPPSTT
jgi:dTDP-glucose pyrophosphorylase